METKLKTPFQYYWSDIQAEWRVRDAEGHGAGGFETGTEAREAVDALNSHAALTAALDQCIAALKEACIFAVVIKNGSHGGGEQKELGIKWRSTEEWSIILENLFRAALEQAKKVRGEHEISLDNETA